MLARVNATACPRQVKWNTLASDGWQPAWFVRTWPDKVPLDDAVTTRNNLVIGLGVFEAALPGDHQGNHALPFRSTDSPSDFALPADSPLRGQADMAFADSGLVPTAEFRFPVGTAPLAGMIRWAPGAFQSVAPPRASSGRVGPQAEGDE